MDEPQPTEKSPRYEQDLVRNVRPSDWINPDAGGCYNLVVIGGGTAGLVSAAAAAGLGARVALIEKHRLGGDCLNYGCVPSKAIISSARLSILSRDREEFGVTATSIPMARFETVMDRMRRIRAGISRHDSAQRFKELGVDVYFGEARFRNPRSIEVDGQTLRFRKAVIATGARPFVPAIPGLAETGYLTNETIFSLDEVPERLIVLGAGPIGCEMAQAFRHLGSQVTLVEAGDRVLPREDPDASEALASALVRDGIELMTGTSLERVWLEGGHRFALLSQASENQPQKVTVPFSQLWTQNVTVPFSPRGGIQMENMTVPFLQQENVTVPISQAVGTRREKVTVPFSHLLIAVGRRPNIDGLGLQEAGVRSTAKGVAVNPRLQTSNPRIYAAGDVASSFQFTHAADAMARIVIQNALFYGRKRIDKVTVPWCTYTTPEVARVGLSETEAARNGVTVRVFKVPFQNVDRAILESRQEGFVKILVGEGNDKIVGASIVGENAGELISEITLAMNTGTGLGRLSGIIHPYPTRSESIRKAADAYNRTRLKPGIHKLLQRWFAFVRG